MIWSYYFYGFLYWLSREKESCQSASLSIFRGSQVFFYSNIFIWEWHTFSAYHFSPLTSRFNTTTEGRANSYLNFKRLGGSILFSPAYCSCYTPHKEIFENLFVWHKGLLRRNEFYISQVHSQIFVSAQFSWTLQSGKVILNTYWFIYFNVKSR